MSQTLAFNSKLVSVVFFKYSVINLFAHTLQVEKNNSINTL